jgi:hypothetical protein
MVFTERRQKRLRIMRYIDMFIFGMTFLAAAGATATGASTYSIPVDKVDAQKVYYGTAAGFSKPGNVDYEAVIKATPEYESVKKKKIEPGTGKYWILLSQASDRAARAISTVGVESGYDLIASQGYLGSLQPPIPAEDITQLIVAKVNFKNDGKSVKNDSKSAKNDDKSDGKKK